MKRLMIVFVVLIALISVVNATNCANDEQIIMRLNRASNAHGALWNEESYEIKICYDNIFNELFTGANAHTRCGGVLKLSAPVNAHAEKYDLGNYNAAVCHAGLANCEFKNAGDGCGTKKAIIYLSGMTNAHLSKTQAGFNYVVCCEKSTREITCTETRCSEYGTMSRCNSDPCGVAQTGCTAPNGIPCRCEWDNSAPIGQKCKQAFDSQVGDCKYTCEISTIQSECIDDLMDVTINATIKPKSGNCGDVIANPPDDCKDSTVTGVPCRFAITELPFFGMWQFAISGFGIMLIYFIFRRRR